MSTANDILLGAYAKSSKNEPGEIATAATELLRVVRRAMRGVYAFAARVNPTYFATSAAVAYAAPGWLRPDAAESVFRIETADGTEVVVVPFEDRAAETGVPRVYALGRIYRPATTSDPDPQSGSLTFFYAERPTVTALDATLTGWPEAYDELLVLETALHLAGKDDRDTETARLMADRDRWAQLFTAFLEHETANVRRRWAPMQRFHNPAALLWHPASGGTA